MGVHLWEDPFSGLSPLCNSFSSLMIGTYNHETTEGIAKRRET